MTGLLRKLDTRHIESGISRCVDAQVAGEENQRHSDDLRRVECRRAMEYVRVCLECCGVDCLNTDFKCVKCGASSASTLRLCCRCGLVRPDPRRKHYWSHNCKVHLRDFPETLGRAQMHKAQVEAFRLLDCVRPPIVPSAWFFVAGSLLLPKDFCSMDSLTDDGGSSDIFRCIVRSQQLLSDGSVAANSRLPVCIKCPRNSHDRTGSLFSVHDKTVLEASVQSAASACPFVLPIFAVALLREGIATVMPVCDCNLSGLLQAQTLSVPDLWAAFGHVCKALAYVHAMDFCHMDVKLENVLWMGSVGRFLLCDFGCVSRIGSVVNYELGTMPYVAPEIRMLDDDSNNIRQPVSITSSCDSFGLGLFLAEVFCDGSRVPDDVNAGWDLLSFLLEKCDKGDESSAECYAVASKCLIDDPIRRWTASRVLSDVRTRHPDIDDQVVKPQPKQQE